MLTNETKFGKVRLEKNQIQEVKMTLSKEFMAHGPVIAYPSTRRSTAMIKGVFPGIKINISKTTLSSTLKEKPPRTSTKNRVTSRG